MSGRRISSARSIFSAAPAGIAACHAEPHLSPSATCLGPHMAATDPSVLATPAAGVPLTPGPAVDAWFSAALDIASTLDADEVESKLLHAATTLLSADGVSLWQMHGDSLICPVAVGEGAQQLVGRRAAGDDLAQALDGEQSLAVVSVPLTFGEVGALRVVRDSAAGGPYTGAERETL